uniref:Glutamyl-tRNA(Gln) amidotransferase subunit A, mitochondrial n=1 Tax=Schizophyllum commune (strain H4-8 / FGSC 9210) TaxID=578458 RepID=D8Q1W7_SCHCM
MRAYGHVELRRVVVPRGAQYLSTRYLSTASSLCRKSIELKNAATNAMVFVSDAPAALPNAAGRLRGLPVAVKDNICTRDMPTTCSSAMLKNFTSPFDATVVRLLRENGADIVGKTNCDEFGMGSLNIHSVHGPVVNPCNPWPPEEEAEADSDQRRIGKRFSAGGSSGGSAAAVAAGMCRAALGTDTGGSIRLPASYCGVSGLKPSYGLVSRWGVVSYADSLDCVGVLANGSEDVKDVFDTISPHDPRDPTSAPVSARTAAREQAEARMAEWRQPGSDDITGLRVGVPQEYFPASLAPSARAHLRRALATLAAHGATIVPISLPSTSYALSAYYVIASAEASSNLARYDGMQYAPGTDTSKVSNLYAQTRSAGFGKEVQRRILLGTYALSADAFDNYFLQAQRVRQLVRDDFDRVFSLPNVSPSIEPRPRQPSPTTPAVDVLLHLSAVGTAPELGAPSGALDAYVQDVLTVPASLAGLPALSVALPTSEKSRGEPKAREETNMPIGVSVVGQWGSDGMVLEVGGLLERLYD